MAENKLNYSVVEFCEAAGVSRGLLYKMWSTGVGPKKIKVGKRTLIPCAQARAWIESHLEVAQ